MSDERIPVDKLPEGDRPRMDLRSGAETPVDPEDLVLAEGKDLTEENIEAARRRLAELGAAAVERIVP
ncbi:hypothetical protein [Embleya sp. NBC_00896]|uniref:hypothetical protein n=1 Tax=Embleya sp. NBC_00896 TaxID=2975961 RepID=UPI00386F5563|nr:hypothetical protein OG928_15485 [Embleya sp. NBC_00896]